jgi:hypothetical protein
VREPHLVTPGKPVHSLGHYGLQAGHTVGVLSSPNGGEAGIVRALQQFGCHPVVLDPDGDIEQLSSRIEFARVKLVFALIGQAHVVDQLRVCVAYVHESMTVSRDDFFDGVRPKMELLDEN